MSDDEERRDISLNNAMRRLRELARGGEVTTSVAAHLAEAERQLRLAGEGMAPGAQLNPIQTRVGIAQQHLAWAQLLREREATWRPHRCGPACHADLSGAVHAGDLYEEDEPVRRLVAALETGTPAVSARPQDVIPGSGVAGVTWLPTTSRDDAPWRVILEGVVGSQAYGLATAESDEDRLVVALAPTLTQLGLRPLSPASTGGTRVERDPDRTVHEVGKLCHLLLACNPSVTELLWLSQDLYRVRTPVGDELVARRGAFLSRDRVRAAYLGYATSQVRRLTTRDVNLETEERRRRVEKHARHVWRLLHQGYQLYVMGELTVRLSPSDAVTCRAFGDLVATGNVALARDELAAFGAAFETASSALPERPDETTVERWLRETRIAELSLRGGVDDRDSHA